MARSPMKSKTTAFNNQFPSFQRMFCIFSTIIPFLIPNSITSYLLFSLSSKSTVISFAVSLCPVGFIRMTDGQCYSGDYYATTTSYTEATQKCQREDASLPIIRNLTVYSQTNQCLKKTTIVWVTLQDNQIILSLALRTHGVSAYPVWLGMQCSDDTSCMWHDGTPVLYRRFMQGKKKTNIRVSI
jgi:hypothetical protein